MTKNKCSAAILSGGLNLRMDGQNKAFLPIGDETILSRMDRTLRSSFAEILLVTNEPMLYLTWDFTIVTDLFPMRSSLSGIHTALFHSMTDYTFVVACDMPFLNRGIIEALINEVAPKWDAIVPVTENGFQPLCAIYSKRCLSSIEEQLRRETPKIVDLYKHIRIREVPTATLKNNDPELLSFFNINRPADLARAQTELAQFRKQFE